MNGSPFLRGARWAIVIGVALYLIALSVGWAGLLAAEGTLFVGWIGVALAAIASLAALSVQLTTFAVGRRADRRRTQVDTRPRLEEL